MNKLLEQIKLLESIQEQIQSEITELKEDQKKARTKIDGLLEREDC